MKESPLRLLESNIIMPSKFKIAGKSFYCIPTETHFYCIILYVPNNVNAGL